jgi:hypothetical protein
MKDTGQLTLAASAVCENNFPNPIGRGKESGYEELPGEIVSGALDA